MSAPLYNKQTDTFNGVKVAVYTVLGIIATVAILVFASAGCKEYNRYQKRADANNQVAITRIMQDKAAEQAKVNYAQIAATKAEAEKRYQESVGIRRAQDEISSTLTPLYV